MNSASLYRIFNRFWPQTSASLVFLRSKKTSASPSHFIMQIMKARTEHAANSTSVLTQVGSFFEMYGKCAEKLGPLLSLAMTSKPFRLTEGADPERISFCGFPLAQLDNKIEILVQRHGIKIALYDEYLIHPLDRGSTGRRLKRIYTPGTLIEEPFISAEDSNYICALQPDSDGSHYHICWADLSTGELGERTVASIDLKSELAVLNPSEVVINRQDSITSKLIGWTPTEGPVLSYVDLKQEICQGPRHMLSEYVKKCFPFYSVQLGRATDLIEPTMRLDPVAVNTLEITRGRESKTLKDSLLGAVKRGKTAGGNRLLLHRLLYPSASLKEINDRHDVISFLLANPPLKLEISTVLSGFPDAARILARIKSLIGFKDVYLLHSVLELLSAIHQLLGDQVQGIKPNCDPTLDSLFHPFSASTLSLSHLERSIASCRPAENVKEAQADDDLLLLDTDESAADGPDPSETDVDDGSILSARSASESPFFIRPDFSPEFEEGHRLLQQLLSRKEALLAEFQNATNSKTMLIQDKRLGPVVRAQSSQKNKIEGPVAKSTKMASFVHNPAWGELYYELLHAEGYIQRLEKKVLEDLQSEINTAMPSIEKAIELVHELDVATGLATVAEECAFVRPEMDESHDLIIDLGRHPVVEKRQPEAYQATSLSMSSEKGRFIVVTGPNMAGKSTNLRQAALIVILAQAGSFVPARYAKIGLVDRIYTRIGAQDNLAAGTSTFMQEMQELANILENATSRSLVLLDEIGRGTAPNDGIAISYASAKHLVDTRSRTIFATHLHDVCDLLLNEKDQQGIDFKHTTAEIDEESGKVRFDYTLKDGISRDSKGVVTAKLAGVPEKVLAVARKTLDELNSKR